MTVWFTSDNHFGHVNIIEYCKRPFTNVDEMNETMVERWNARVKPQDTVYHLGDFATGPSGTAAKWRARLNGRIWLVLGNHDRSAKHMTEAGLIVIPSGPVEIADKTGDLRNFWISHRPPRDEARFADYCLHGHVHETYARRENLINVGVDARGFQPVTLYELLEA